MIPTIIAPIVVLVVGLVLLAVLAYLKSDGVQRRRIARDGEKRIIQDDTDAFKTKVEMRRIANEHRRNRPSAY